MPTAHEFEAFEADWRKEMGGGIMAFGASLNKHFPQASDQKAYHAWCAQRATERQRIQNTCFSKEEFVDLVNRLDVTKSDLEADLNTITLRSYRPVVQLGHDRNNIRYRLIPDSFALRPTIVRGRSDHFGIPLLMEASVLTFFCSSSPVPKMVTVPGESPHSYCFRQLGILESSDGADSDWEDTGFIVVGQCNCSGALSAFCIIYDPFLDHSLLGDECEDDKDEPDPSDTLGFLPGPAGASGKPFSTAHLILSGRLGDCDNSYSHQLSFANHCYGPGEIFRAKEQNGMIVPVFPHEIPTADPSTSH